MAATSPVTAVGTSLRDIFRPVQVRRSRAAVPGRAEYLYVVNEVAVCHIAAKIRFFGELATSLHILRQFAEGYAGSADAEAAADVEDGLAGDAVEFAEAVDRSVIGLGDLVEGVAALDDVVLGFGGVVSRRCD